LPPSERAIKRIIVPPSSWISDGRGNRWPDSGFWRDLAEKFSELALSLAALRAEYYYTQDSEFSAACRQPCTALAEWKLRGTPGRALTFETLARRGASVLPHAIGSELLHVWLEAVKSVSGTFRLELCGIEQEADGSDGARHYTGTIVRVCEASADYCREMENKAREAELRAGQQNAAQAEDPKVSETAQFRAESIGRQINRYREACQMTVEDLAAKLEIGTRTVQRHLANASVPHPRHLSAYGRVFSRLLNKRIVIKKMP
jgi:ribosome-binding protein aMBF1 (putative translation factor)